jgi:ABC-2 type transport system ATP-binding protein
MEGGMMSGEVMVQTRGLTRRFAELTAVNCLDLEISRGEIFGLVGPDGAGKTTTLRLLCGLLDQTDGEVTIAGLDLRRNLDAVRDRIGYMAQRFGLYLDLTVQENMSFYADLFGISLAERDALTARLLLMTRMEPFKARAAGKLSGGMKQKLALMCALLHRPEVLFLDEPTNGVDPVSRRDFWAILYQLVKEGMTVVITTAYLDEAERCNRVGLMHRGRLICCDAPGALKNRLEETCYELVTSNARAAREILAGLSGVLSVEPSGASLHLFLDAERRSPASVEKELAGHGISLASIRQIMPSLEDVFIALIHKVHIG